MCLYIKFNTMKKYLRLGQKKCKHIAMKDMRKEYSEGKFFTNKLIVKDYLMKLLSEIDRSYVQIK